MAARACNRYGLPDLGGRGLGPGASSVADSGASVTALFREHHADLVRLAVLMTGDRASAEDIVQDVFARPVCPRPAAGSRRRARVRAGRRPERLPQRAAPPGCRAPLRGRARRHGRRTSTQQIRGAARRCWPRTAGRCWPPWPGCPRRRREVLVLRYWLGLPEAEIAADAGGQSRHRQVNRRARDRRPGARARGASMTRTEDRLTDALAAAARAVPQDTPPPAHRPAGPPTSARVARPGRGGAGHRPGGGRGAGRGQPGRPVTRSGSSAAAAGDAAVLRRKPAWTAAGIPVPWSGPRPPAR